MTKAIVILLSFVAASALSAQIVQQEIVNTPLPSTATPTKRQYNAPGVGYINSVTTREVLAPGSAEIDMTTWLFLPAMPWKEEEACVA